MIAGPVPSPSGALCSCAQCDECGAQSTGGAGAFPLSPALQVAFSPPNPGSTPCPTEPDPNPCTPDSLVTIGPQIVTWDDQEVPYVLTFEGRIGLQWSGTTPDSFTVEVPGGWMTLTATADGYSPYVQNVRFPDPVFGGCGDVLGFTLGPL